MLRLIASVVLSVCIAAPAAASGSYLRGLTKATIVVGGVDRDSISCGVREEVLLPAVKVPIRAYTKILETFTYQVPVINVSITTISGDVLALPQNRGLADIAGDCSACWTEQVARGEALVDQLSCKR